MGQMQTVGKTATSIKTDKTDKNGWTEVTYHDTTVVSFNDRYVILRTGGWQTATTKARMNQAANQFYLGYQVSQKDFIWSVNDEVMLGNEVIIDRKTRKILFNEVYKDSRDKWYKTLKKIGYPKN